MRMRTSRLGGCERNSVRPIEIGKFEYVLCAGGVSEDEDEFKCKPCGINSGEVEEIIGVDGRDVDEDEESGTRKTVKIQDPVMPTKAEREEHEKTHLPFRSWCRHCVRGRGKEMPHRSSSEETVGPEMSFDFFFLGDEDGSKSMTVLMAIERATRMKMCTPVPSKSTGEFVARRILAFMKETGCKYGDMVVKSDQEKAIVAILEKVGKLRSAEGGGRMIFENSPVADSQGNGLVERAIQSSEGMVRVLRSQLEERWGVKISSTHPVLTWMVGHAAVLLNRFEVARDGKTAYERMKKKTAKVLGLEFGEKVLWRRKPVGGALGKMSCMWEDGIYLGIKATTGELIVGTEKGVWKTRSIQRRPFEERWNVRAAKMVGGVPWRVSGEDQNADGEKLEVEATEPVGERMKEEEEKPILDELRVPRSFYIKGTDFEAHGYTKSCPGCLAILRKTTRQKHSPECRRRMERALEGEERVTRAKKRRDDFIDKAIEKEDEEMRKAEETLGQSSDIKEKRARDEAVPEDPGEKRVRGEAGATSSSSSSSPHSAIPKVEGASGQKRKRDDDEDEDMGINYVPVLEVQMDVVNQEEMDEKFADEWATDDVTGKVLNREAVDEARREEIQFMKKIGVYKEVPITECIKKTGKGPMSTRWVDTDKGKDLGELIRSRLVARDFKVKGDGDRPELFAATPPLEALRMLLRMARMKRARRFQRKKWKLMYIDVKKAHLNAKVDEDEHIYVELPVEAEAKDGYCARLLRWLYGTRPAASSWEKEYTEKLESEGYVRGRAAPTTFYNKEKDARCVVHGDDFTFLAEEEELRRMAELMAKWYEVKVRAIMGPDAKDAKEVVILGRTVRWLDDRIEYEADGKYVKVIIEEMGLEEVSNGVEGPVGQTKAEDLEDDEELSKDEAKDFRRVAATANYLASDRPDIQFATKEICRDMSKPKRRSWEKLKRLARYLIKYPRMVVKFVEGVELEDMYLEAMVDSDWAGCLATRRSTSGGVVSVGGGMMKSWSSTQASTAMSSGEAEYYAMVKGASEALGIQALAADLGWSWKVRMWVDSPAAKSIASRTGLGKVRHIEVRFLWLQEVVRAGRIELRKIPGERNPADIMTKPKNAAEVVSKFESLGLTLVSR